MPLDPCLFTPSGLNGRFIGDNLSFAEYTQAMCDIIRRARIDLNPENQQQIIDLNRPFCWQPPKPDNGKYKRGVIMTHGLYDSPFITRDIAQHLLNRGFLVMCVLLPGHGTVPGDLLNIRYREWIRAVDYGIEQIKQQVEQVYYAGFSMGATLMLHHAARNPNINALLLFAPALQLRADHIVTLLPFLKLIDWSSERLKWYRRIPQQDPVKYTSFPFNGPYQIHCLIKEKDKLLAKRPFTTPIFLTMSSGDELIVPQAAVDLLAQNSHPHSKLLLYSNRNLTELPPDTRIEQRCSRFPDLKIIDFSHNCMPIAPDNPLYGRDSGFEDFLHYPGNKPLMSKKEVLLGSIRPENLVRGNMQRLSYNPDFAYMMQAMDRFLDNIVIPNDF